MITSTTGLRQEVHLCNHEENLPDIYATNGLIKSSIELETLLIEVIVTLFFLLLFRCRGNYDQMDIVIFSVYLVNLFYVPSLIKDFPPVYFPTQSFPNHHVFIGYLDFLNVYTLKKI